MTQALSAAAMAPALANNGAGEGGSVVPFTSLHVQPLTPMDMVQQAVASGAGIEVLTKLMDLQERWEAGQARKAFDEAIAAAKSQIKPVVRNRTGHNDKRYADFSAYAREVDPVLAEHGLSYRFRTEQDGSIKVSCILSHKAGHSEENSLAAAADTSGNKNSIQAIGSTLTYLQRYTLTQALGLAASDDDDGRRSESLPISAAAEAAINSLHETRSLEQMTAWKGRNDPMVQRLDRNDRSAFEAAWKAHARAIREGSVQ